jgi:hypothetical protein
MEERERESEMKYWDTYVKRYAYQQLYALSP